MNFRHLLSCDTTVCLSRAREDTKRVRLRSEAVMYINTNVTVMKAKGTF